MKHLRTGNTKRWLALTLVLVLLAGSMSLVYGDNLSDSKDKLADVQQQLKDLQKQLDSGKAEAKSLNTQLNNIDKSIRAAEAAIERLDDDIEATKAQVTKAQEDLDLKEKEVSEQDKDMGLRVRNMYKNGDVGILQILLGSASLTDFMTNMDMAERIYQNDMKLLSELEEQYTSLEQYRKELVTWQETLQKQLESKKQQQDQLEVSRGTVARLKASVESNNKVLESQVDVLNEEANSLTAEILKLQGTADYVGGKMLWPAPASTRVTSKFGMRFHPILKKNKLHTGIDIGVGSGNKVLAANAGTVIKAAWNNSYGYMVMIDHGGGIVTLYAHNSKLLVKTGDIVTRGQQVAVSGSTGMSTGPHLHFEVRVNGVYKDPLTYLQ